MAGKKRKTEARVLWCGRGKGRQSLRATILSLRHRVDPGLSADLLCAVIALGGRVPGVLWTTSALDPTHP